MSSYLDAMSTSAETKGRGEDVINRKIFFYFQKGPKFSEHFGETVVPQAWRCY